VKRRLLAAVAVVVLIGAAAYFFILREKSVAPHLVASDAVAVIGSGSSAVAVAGDGTVLAWLPASEVENLPRLPLEAPPSGPRVQGTVLEQAKVLGAVPAALRPYVEGSYYGESGVDVKLTSGVELRFGSAGQAARKWRAAAAVLAAPTVTALDYVDLHAPGRPAIGGSGHTLPPIP